MGETWPARSVPAQASLRGRSKLVDKPVQSPEHAARKGRGVQGLGQNAIDMQAATQFIVADAT